MNNPTRQPFHKDILKLDAPATCAQIVETLRRDVLQTLRRRGAVVGISGGIDSSVTLALAVRALGAKRVVGIMMPERDSSPDSHKLAQTLADRFGVETFVEDLTGALSGFGCYRRRDEAIARVFPEFDPETYKAKVVLPTNILDQEQLSVSSLTVIAPDGTQQTKRLPTTDYLQIVAASNFKQRSRMSMLYYHAEQRHYAVVGTPNKHERAQGFFVKFGDGGADVMPIEHLYKSQVYQLAEHLGIPPAIIERQPTADTYSAEVSQEEFFFQLPFELLDLLWFGMEKGYGPDEVAAALDLTPEQVERAYQNFRRKLHTTEYLRMVPIRYEDSGLH
jgi:NAD+ synthase